MTEKIEPPSIPDGYGLSYAFLALVDTAKSVQTIVEGPLELTKDSDDKMSAPGDAKGRLLTCIWVLLNVKCYLDIILTPVLYLMWSIM